jgi:hypothetical protein
MWFALWAVPGALVALAIVTALSIGVFVWPIALAAVFLVARRRGGRWERLGQLAGAGALALGIGLAHLTTETRCSAEGTAAAPSSCSTFDPYPWIYAGTAAIALASGLFALATLRQRQG